MGNQRSTMDSRISHPVLCQHTPGMLKMFHTVARKSVLLRRSLLAKRAALAHGVKVRTKSTNLARSRKFFVKPDVPKSLLRRESLTRRESLRRRESLPRNARAKDRANVIPLR